MCYLRASVLFISFRFFTFFSFLFFFFCFVSFLFILFSFFLRFVFFSLLFSLFSFRFFSFRFFSFLFVFFRFSVYRYPTVFLSRFFFFLQNDVEAPAYLRTPGYAPESDLLLTMTALFGVFFTHTRVPTSYISRMLSNTRPGVCIWSKLCKIKAGFKIVYTP